MKNNGQRICHFEEGDMTQEITSEEYGESFSVDIVECDFEVRRWITFVSAGYTFTQKDGYVEVVRRDHITSTLRPRWYWHWFEELCVEMEHRYVLSSMKMQAER